MIKHIYVSVKTQRLFCFSDGKYFADYPISTAKNGLGEKEGSYCTPRGWHQIVEIVGQGLPIYSVFKARIPTGEAYTAELEEKSVDQDWILSRIIRLKGLEKGFNLGRGVDSYQRYIYIHGCVAEDMLGRPVSSGCIRMSNQSVIELASYVRIGDSIFLG